MLRTQILPNLLHASTALFLSGGSPGIAAEKSGVEITGVTRNDTPSATTLELAKGGKSTLPIVVSADASDAMKALAGELEGFLERITGADFEVRVGGSAPGIVLGTLEEFPRPELDAALRIFHAFDGKEAYAIRTLPDRLLLLGATEKGASHAVYRFLEEAGCRWFFPSDNWELVPRHPELAFARDITDRPAFLSRSIWYAWGFFHDDGHPGRRPENLRDAGDDYRRWARRNRMDESFTVNAGHAYEAIARENAEAFAKHPEYWALVDGKRQGPQFELSDPGLRKLAVDWAVDFFRKNPRADMVSVDPADGGGMSESEESRRMGNASDLAFGLANEVARAVEQAYPGQNKMVGMYAYNWHSDPPPFALELNVYIQNHWEAIRQDSIRQPSQPDAPTPWKVDRPIAAEETEAWFQDGLRHYPELTIPEEISFSDELVAVDFGGEGLDSSQLYQEGSSYAVFSVKGEPLRFRIKTGSAYGGLKQTFEVTDAMGKVLKQGKPKPDEALAFEVPVPSPGVYFFRYHDHGAYGEVFWSKEQIVSLPLRERAFRAMAQIAPMSFYVPKGTTEIHYHYKRADWQFGGPHQLIAPDGTVVKEVAVDGDYVSVPVPAGADGGRWTIGGATFGLGEFRFFNVPNYLSPSPARMLLPRDVVERDGLRRVECGADFDSRVSPPAAKITADKSLPPG